MKPEIKRLGKLFTSTFLISAFTFGGGYVIVPLMRKKFVEELKWVNEQEILNLIAIAQSSPGAVAVNASILLGYRAAGILGGLTALLGTILPPFLILSVVSVFYSAFRDNRVVSAVLKGMQAGVAAVIIDVVYSMGRDVVKEKDLFSILIMTGAFVAAWAFGVNVVYVILACGMLGGILTMLAKTKEAK